MRILSYVFTLFLMLLGISFAVLNAEPVLINFYVGSSKLPLSLLLVLALIFGVVLGLIVSLTHYIRLKRANSRLRQRLKLVEKEVSNLRAIPLKDEH